MIPTLYRFLIRAGKIAGGATFIFGIIYGAFQYYEAKQDRRIEQTLSWYRQFNSPPVSKYRENISRAVAKHQDAIRAAARDETQLSEAVLATIRGEDIEHDIMLLLDFFDGLIYCVTSELCDRQTSVSLFYPRARELYITFYQYIALRRKAAKTFGNGLEQFATIQ
jgi:hypothetical protein